MIEIWSPRWHDRKVLIATYKVKDGINDIVFTKTKSLEGKVFKVDGVIIRKYPVTTNGKIQCYEVPLNVLDNPAACGVVSSRTTFKKS